MKHLERSYKAERLWRRIRQVPYQKRVVMIALAVVLGGVSLLFTSNMAKMLQHKEMNEMALWSYAM